MLQRDPALAARSVDITLAGDGEKGLLALQQGPFDLVISDLLMPKMDGFAFCRALRRHPQGERVPLLVSSAVYKDAITLRKLRVELDAEFFTKPFQVSEMIRAVRRLVGVDKPATGTQETRHKAPVIGTSGSLAERSLPCLLLDFFESEHSCCLLVERGELIRRVYVLLGHVIAIESNSRNSALGGFLLDRGLITEEQLCEALKASMQDRRRLGQVLVDRGLLSETELLRQMEAQLRTRLASLFRLRDAVWRIQPMGPTYERITPPEGTPALVFSSLRDTVRPDEVGAMRRRMGARLLPTPRAVSLKAAFESTFGPGTLSVLDSQPLLTDLLSGLNPVEKDTLLVRVDAMLQCGLCHAQEGGMEPKTRQRPLRTQANRVSALAAMPSTAAVSKSGPPAASLNPRHRALLSEYLAVGGRNFYELLGVQRTAEVSAIHAAQRAAMERLSPERFIDLDLGPDYSKISELRERYCHAHAILSSPLRRAVYDRELSQAEEVSPRMIEAELLFRQAEAQVSRGELGLALSLSQQAVTIAPDQADYHALLGWLHFLCERHAGKEAYLSAQAAWPHLTRALAIDDDHVPAHACSGHIAVAIGQDEVASQHFERALDLAPDRQDVLCGLEQSLGRLEQWHRLALRYQKMLRRLAVCNQHARPQGFQQTQETILRKLAHLYQGALRDRDAA
jgi:CheY-like chemotaxis protein/tetratricopeptide (TPR) repeat protein